MPDMQPPGGRLWRYVAVAVLSLLTLGVFYVLQDYGPESAIRRFHDAIVRGDGVELQRVTMEDIRSPNVRLLARDVNNFLRNGAYQLVRMERSQTQVKAAVVYRAKGSSELFPMIWVVEKQGSIWKVNADKTLTILRDNLGM